MNRLIGLGLCLWLAAAAVGEVGDLTPSAECKIKPLLSRQMYVYSRGLKRPAKGAGTVWRKASVGKLEGGTGKIAVAVDATDAKAGDPNILRLDFTGKGAFGKCPTLPLTNTNKNGTFYSRLGPSTLNVRRGAKSIPVRVGGFFYASGKNRQVRLDLNTALIGECRFGEKTYPVAVVDGDNNLRPTDPAKVVRKPTGVQIAGGDTVAVTCGTGDAATVIKAFVGQPIFVDGAWYRVKIARDGSTIIAKPVARDTAHVTVSHEKWNGMITSGSSIIALKGGAGPFAVPAGRYQVVSYTETVLVDVKEGRRSAVLSCSPSKSGGMGKIQNLPAGETTELLVGSPVQVRVLAKARRRNVQLDFKMTDVAGLGIDYLLNSQEKRPTPKVEIRDAKGKVVHSGAFEYG